MSIFFVVSCIVQAASGFLVDRVGARPVLFSGMSLLILSALLYSQANGYAILVLASIVAGCGNGVFHPVDYTLINHKVSPLNLPYAYSVHGLTGYLGWAAAPAFMVAIASLTDWRIAFVASAVFEALILLILWINRALLFDSAKERHEESRKSHAASNPGGAPMSAYGFLTSPAVWLCWIFFLFSVAATSGLQSFAPSALFEIYRLDVGTGNYFLTLMALGGAGGMLLGAYIATRFKSPERIITICFVVSIVMSLLLATGWLAVDAVVIPFIVIGLGIGVAAPSRDLMVRAATPVGASGRVYGIVYSGIDLGAAIGPLVFGIFMDANLPKFLFIGVALFQLIIIFTAFKVANQAKAA